MDIIFSLHRKGKKKMPSHDVSLFTEKEKKEMTTRLRLLQRFFTWVRTRVVRRILELGFELGRSVGCSGEFSLGFEFDLPDGFSLGFELGCSDG